MAETGEEQIEGLVSLKDAFADDREEYENDIREVRNKLPAVIEKWWGPRCEATEQTCPACAIWAAFDVISSNPFEMHEREETKLD